MVPVQSQHMIKLSKQNTPSNKIGKKRGKLIIIEGADGTGKATQAELLVEHLKKNHFRVKYYDFPQYHNNFFGDMAARYLRGEYGSFLQSSPYLVSLPYALDRASVAEEMKSWLARGGGGSFAIDMSHRTWLIRQRKWQHQQKEMRLLSGTSIWNMMC